MVGHTHDDVDQMFGCFSRGFSWKQKPLFTFDDMLQSCRDNFKPTPKVCKLRYLYDWKSFLDCISNHAVRGKNLKLHGHLRPLQFWFTILPTSKDGRAFCRFKRFSTEEKWRPFLPETPDVILLHSRKSLSELGVLPLKPVDVELFKDVVHTFNICKNLDIILDVDTDVWLTIPSMLQTWSGYKMVNQKPVFVGQPEAESLSIIPEEQKWGTCKCLEDGTVVIKKHTIILQEEENNSQDAPIFQADVLSDAEDDVYQGKLHSQDVNYKTNTKMFVDVRSIQEGQLILVRRPDTAANPIELCKVTSWLGERVLQIHWYGGRSITGVQHALSKKRQRGNKKAAKNVPYLDEINVDTVLTDEPFELTNQKKIPKRIMALAKKRLQTAQTIQNSR